VNGHYVTIPPDDYGWLTAACHIRDLAALAVAILQAAGVEEAAAP